MNTLLLFHHLVFINPRLLPIRLRFQRNVRLRRIGSSKICISESDFIPAPARARCQSVFAEKLLGVDLRISVNYLKEPSDEENKISEDESENEDFVEIQNDEFADGDKDENDELSFESTDDAKIILEKQTQKDENKNLKSEAKAEVSNKSEIPNFFNSCDKSIIFPGEIQLTCKDKSKWTYVPKSSNTRTAARNIIHFIQGSKNLAKELYNPRETFNQFFTPQMLEKLVSQTNSEIKRQKISAMKNNHLPPSELFDTTLCGQRYKAEMSEMRFCILLNCLRFDSKETRKEIDKFTPIGEFRDELIRKCTDSYKSGSYVTVDEQLLAYRGRCPFRMYI
ncbi:piggyBac transposable element-derived protein 4 [Nephila pilipes]|uniref:PiggyBac transposable element-derived protein 4 n=1 Tax=Nephila pilipes TaxID=299642 RepID=A0A8X6PRK2_NEPPI|nr:piggyBac transposable element-derived protein 4 [Nephila pilipes]